MVTLIIKTMKGRCASCTGPSQLRCKHSRLLGNHVHWGVLVRPGAGVRQGVDTTLPSNPTAC